MGFFKKDNYNPQGAPVKRNPFLPPGVSVLATLERIEAKERSGKLVVEFRVDEILHAYDASEEGQALVETLAGKTAVNVMSANKYRSIEDQFAPLVAAMLGYGDPSEVPEDELFAAMDSALEYDRSDAVQVKISTYGAGKEGTYTVYTYEPVASADAAPPKKASRPKTSRK